ncbi:MAG: ABC transporter substrate-binding protein [Chloroflexota bacterium]|mgnify:CR=1 FL=1
MRRVLGRPSRRQFIQGGLGLVGIGLLAGCSRLAGPRQPPETRRIGFLAQVPEPYHEALFAGLRELGYVEGENLVVERRFANGPLEKLPALASELMQLRVDVLVSGGAGTNVLRASEKIPTVVVQADAVDVGMVASLARPGGNVTGISVSTPALATKRLEILREACPSIARVAVLDGGFGTANQAQAIDAAATKLGLTLRHYDMTRELGARVPGSPTAFFDAIRGDRPEALIVLDSSFMTLNRALITTFAADRRLPAVYPQRVFVDDGGWISYGPNYADMYHRAASYVDKILKGANPGEIPMEQPTSLDFVVNLKTSQALGLTVLSSVLQQATDVIQ